MSRSSISLAPLFRCLIEAKLISALSNDVCDSHRCDDEKASDCAKIRGYDHDQKSRYDKKGIKLPATSDFINSPIPAESHNHQGNEDDDHDDREVIVKLNSRVNEKAQNKSYDVKHHCFCLLRYIITLCRCF